MRVFRRPSGSLPRLPTGAIQRYAADTNCCCGTDVGGGSDPCDYGIDAEFPAAMGVSFSGVSIYTGENVWSAGYTTNTSGILTGAYCVPVMAPGSFGYSTPSGVTFSYAGPSGDGYVEVEISMSLLVTVYCGGRIVVAVVGSSPNQSIGSFYAFFGDSGYGAYPFYNPAGVTLPNLLPGWTFWALGGDGSVTINGPC